MESQYYTPEVEEFHKGFEFEWFDNQFKKQSFRITTDDDLEIIEDEIRERKIRVKYLDREDVKSLGWNYSNLAKNFCILTTESDGENNQGLWLNSIQNKYQIIDCRIPMHQVLFFGTIKNKSELKKIMIQTGIVNK